MNNNHGLSLLLSSREAEIYPLFFILYKKEFSKNVLLSPNGIPSNSYSAFSTIVCVCCFCHKLRIFSKAFPTSYYGIVTNCPIKILEYLKSISC